MPKDFLLSGGLWLRDLFSPSLLVLMPWAHGEWTYTATVGRKRSVAIFGLFMFRQSQEGLAAVGVYARESWHREWRKELADE